MSAWSEAAWVIRELTKKLKIEEKIEEMVDEVPIVIIASKNENENSPNISSNLNIPKESIWFVIESENNTEGE